MPFLVLALLAAGPVYDVPEVPDPTLAQLRGGIRLPNGVDVEMTVQSQTAVDKAIVLRTVFAIDQGPATLTIYAPKPGETVAAPASAGTSAGGMAPPQLSFDGRGGVQVIPGAVRTTNVAAGVGGAEPVPDGLEQVAGGAVTDNGRITETAGGVRTVTLAGPQLAVTHLAGAAFGTVIANSGSDRAIDTVTTVTIDLRNAGADVVGSTMFRVENVALSAIRDRVR